MQNKEDIYAELKRLLIDLFEIDESKITLDATLYEDLDLDSIDAIDLVVKLQQMTQKKVNPEDFKSARHVRDVVDVVYKLIRQ
jgi:acyl carrier protein